MQQANVLLDVYGVTVSIASTDTALAVELGEDFAYFQRETVAGPAPLSVLLHVESPPYDEVPPRAATVYTPRNVSFREGETTYIDYSGRALGVLNMRAKHLAVYSLDRDLLYEVGYLFLLSQLSELLDAKRLHRVHALGFGLANRGALVLLPMGGGKSTLATHLLRDPRVQFLSDDSPVVDRKGMLHAMPLRIGILPGSESGYNEEQLRTVQRMEFGPKLLLRYQEFASRVLPEAPPAFVFLGKRSLAAECRILPATRFKALMALVPNCIIGIGLFQGMEFVFHRGFGEIFDKARVAFSRLCNCIALVRRAQPVILLLGRNPEQNAATLLEFMQRAVKD